MIFLFFGSSLAHIEPKLELFEIGQMVVRQIIINVIPNFKNKHCQRRNGPVGELSSAYQSNLLVVKSVMNSTDRKLTRRNSAEKILQNLHQNSLKYHTCIKKHVAPPFKLKGCILNHRTCQVLQQKCKITCAYTGKKIAQQA